MKEKNQKKLMTVLSTGVNFALSSMLANRLINVPERPGIKDDIKEAALKAAFTVVATSIASVLVRELTRDQ